MYQVSIIIFDFLIMKSQKLEVGSIMVIIMISKLEIVSIFKHANHEKDKAYKKRVTRDNTRKTCVDCVRTAL